MTIDCLFENDSAPCRFITIFPDYDFEYDLLVDYFHKHYTSIPLSGNFFQGSWIDSQQLDKLLQQEINEIDAKIQMREREENAEKIYILKYRERHPESDLSDTAILMEHLDIMMIHSHTNPR